MCVHCQCGCVLMAVDCVAVAAHCTLYNLYILSSAAVVRSGVRSRVTFVSSKPCLFAMLCRCLLESIVAVVSHVDLYSQDCPSVSSSVRPSVRQSIHFRAFFSSGAPDFILIASGAVSQSVLPPAVGRSTILGLTTNYRTETRSARA